jgi:intracellular sulfur oxidation DsrE/DsrF family protein
MIIRLIFLVCLLTLISLGAAGSVAADSSLSLAVVPNDKAALSGLSEVKVIFDVTTGNPNILLNRLTLIEYTHNSIVQQGAAARMIIAFRQEATLLDQKDFSRVKPADRQGMQKVQAKIRTMSKVADYRFEQCSYANREFKVNNEDTIPEVKVVGDTFISLIAYQNKGYAYIPIKAG